MKPAGYLFAVCLWTLWLRAAPSSSHEMRGVVLDARGLPLADATLAEQWGVKKGAARSPLTPLATTTHADGSFVLTYGSDFNGRFALLVYDKARLQGAIVDLPASERERPLTIRLRPLQTVHYSILIPGSLANESMSAELYTSTGIPIAALFNVARGSVTLPPGQYLIKARLPDAEVAARAFSVATQEVTVPPLHIQPSLIAQHYGHGTPDLTPSLLTMDHRPATIQPVRGKWTLLYFWAIWCGPCISEGIPELIAFTNDHKNSSSAFRIVAIHEKSKGENSTWREFHDKTVLLQHERWHVTSLPFDVLYDESSRLTSAWGVVAFPTYALIDPDGNLVPQGNLKTLEEKLRQ